MKKRKLFLISAAALILFAIPVLTLWLTITDYRPMEIEKAEIINTGDSEKSDEITILNWNLGYGGLGSDMDFFMDGGSQVKASKELYRRNWEGITSFLGESQSQIYFFQEMDRRSSRSYKQDQYESMVDVLGIGNRTFASNYKVKFIPSPRIIGTQYGTVHSGLSIFSSFSISESERHSLPGNYHWPKSVFFLDRCLLISKVKWSNNKEIVLINAHLSAYDKGGFLKKEQLVFLKERAVEYYNQGYYVIIGGDWNSYMPGTDESSFHSKEEIPVFYQSLPDDWELTGWNWGVDPAVPTNRSLAASYEPGKTFTSVIDGFLVSPNISITGVKTYDLGFQFSDHNPTEIRLKLQ